MKIIDAHVHFIGSFRSALDLRIINICIEGEDRKKAEEDQRAYQALHLAHPDKYAWIGRISLAGFEERDYSERVIRQIPLCTHVAEPIWCWRKPSDDNPYCKYYVSHPEFHMYNHPDFPSHERLMAARDSIVADFPGLPMVAAHLASLAHDVDLISERFEKYPNMAADLSGPARWVELGMQPHDKVHSFFIKYQDRLLYGSDRSTGKIGPDVRPVKDVKQQEMKAMENLQCATKAGLRYFGTDDEFEFRGKKMKGLALPQSVLEKMFYSNALCWYPGLIWQ